MLKHEGIIDSCMLTVGGAYSLANIESILGIIILCIQISWIFIKLLAKIINRIKSKKPISTIAHDILEAAKVSLEIIEENDTEESNNGTSKE